MKNEFIHIESINLGNLKNDFELQPGKESLDSLSKVNMFIGENNSRKSFLLRRLFFNKVQKVRIKHNCILEAINQKDNFINIIQKSVGSSKISDIEGAHIDRFNLNSEFDLDLKDVKLNHIIDITNLILNKIYQNRNDINFRYINGVHAGNQSVPNIHFRNSIEQKTLEQIQTDIDRLTKRLKLSKKFYIPTMRSLNCIDSSNDIWVARNRNAVKTLYFKNSDIDEQIITGDDLYDLLDRMLRGSHEERAAIRSYEEFLSKNFYKEKQVTLIPKYGSKVVSIKIGDDADYPIHEVGDGIQQTILCTYKLFLTKEPSYFFIEEPDLYMHPGLQRKLIETYLNDPGIVQHQIFLTTHSNHLLDIVDDYSDISIYKFKKEEGKTKISSVLKKDFDLISDLGVRPSSMYLTNCLIWVEGVSDRIYFKYFLNKYMASKHKFFEEDRHFSFIEYGGANLPHIVFDFDKIDITSISPNNYLILDGDTEIRKPDWLSRLNAKNTIFGENYSVLEYKEIENYFSFDAYRRVFGEKVGTIISDEQQAEVEDRRIVKENGYAQTLDKYIKIKIRDNTFANKAKLANALVSSNEMYDDKINLICENLYNYIEKCNH